MSKELRDFSRDDLSVFGDVDRAKGILLAICSRRVDGWPRTLVYKIFWHAHLRHMAQNGRALSDWPIVWMTHGPGIEKGDVLLDALEGERAILQEKKLVAGERESIIAKPLDRARVDGAWTSLSDAQRESIEWACKLLWASTSEEASLKSHLDSRAWQAYCKHPGRELPIYTDLIEDDERLARMRDARAAFRKALSGNS